MENFKVTRPNQATALQMLMKLGYTYIPSAAPFSHKVLFEDILGSQLRKLNLISYRKKQYPLSEENVFLAIEKLNILFHGRLFRTNEKIYDLITVPQPCTQIIEGSIRNFDLVYIDWKNWENNVYHCARYLSKRIQHDIILYINGIPLAVLPCKSPERNVSGEVFHQERKYLPDLSSYVRLLFSAKDKNDILLQGIAKVHSLLKQPTYEQDNFGETLKVCEEASPYIADIIEKNLLDL